MKIIKEVNSKNETYYEVYIGDTLIEKIRIKKIIQEMEDKKYIFLLHSNGKVIDDVFIFLNEEMKNKSINSREVAANALKLLFSFLEIKKMTVSDLTLKDINLLSDFILGKNINGNIETYLFRTYRCNSTHNLYFNEIRNFIDTLKNKNSLFFKRRALINSNLKHNINNNSQHNKVDKYVTNKTIVNKNRFAPKYISPTDFQSILKVINTEDNKNKLRDTLIILLMYTRGMRLGEVLGLTLEDIKISKRDNLSGKIILRNRVSDKKYQMSKGCINVISKDIYKLDNYKKKNEGYQEIILAPQLITILKRYLDESRDIFSISEKLFDNISGKAVADSVENSKRKNYYIFLNKNGTPLSSSGWNKILKTYFNKCNIRVDEENKSVNLSHRFRHGYAMYLIVNEKKSIEYVKTELRHRSIASTLIYYNPTEEDILEKSKEVNSNLFSLLEDIKYGDF
ncbi:site-specific integrase [Clostridium sp.]|uniref:tyrosine-type recombinase/integrase n=1 Tax=Clostridium sp. TaxID=1506 RepID=UPI00290C5299|nr:site-specific integrase [Clostridium sp.]MDU7364098.1 site-specific integrase [Clostridium sp.]